MRFLLYGLIRIVVFVGVWYLCMALDFGMVLSLVVALILSFAVGYLGLRRGVGRPGTPATPGAADRTASPLPSSAAPDESGTNFEASIVQSVEIDLGDF